MPFIEDESKRRYIEDLYFEHRHVMYIVAKALLHDAADAQDAIAQAIENIIPKINEIKTLERFKLRAYIVNTVRNVALAMLARRKRETYIPDAEEFDCIAPHSAVGDRQSSMADADELARALAKLPERERQALQMKYMYEWTDDEMAQVLGVQPDSVRMILSRARQHARAILESEGTYGE